MYVDSKKDQRMFDNLTMSSQLHALQVTPAMSREENMECYVEGFYDYHDVWHFFSACGMFFAFLVSTIIVHLKF